MVLGLVMNWPLSAEAHRLLLFAWVEGSTVYAESKFYGGKALQSGSFSVYNGNDDLVLQGKLSQGQLAFQVAQAIDLKLVVDSPDGHRAEWLIEASEITQVGPAFQLLSEDILASAATPHSEIESPSNSPSSSTLDSVDASDFQELIEESVQRALQKELRSIKAQLAEMQQPGPSLQDILGGMGYIIGLVGLGAYLHARRQQRPPSDKS